MNKDAEQLREKILQDLKFNTTHLVDETYDEHVLPVVIESFLTKYNISNGVDLQDLDLRIEMLKDDIKHWRLGFILVSFCILLQTGIELYKLV